MSGVGVGGSYRVEEKVYFLQTRLVSVVRSVATFSAFSLLAVDEAPYPFIIFRFCVSVLFFALSKR